MITAESLRLHCLTLRILFVSPYIFRENCQLNCKNDAIFVESDAKTKSLVLPYNKTSDTVVTERGDDIHKRVL